VGEKPQGIRYDGITLWCVLQVTESQIEKALGDIGLQPGGSWLEHLRRAWVHNSEEIELDNLAAPRYHQTRPQA